MFKFQCKTERTGRSQPPPGRTGRRSEGGGLAPPSLFSFTLKFEHMAKNILKSIIFEAIYLQRDLLSANILERCTFNEIYVKNSIHF